MEILNLDTIDFNLCPNDNYFQTNEISQLIYNHLHNSENKISIMNSNLCINKYNNNHIFIHVRLGDVINYNPGFSYFKNAIDKIINENKVIEDILIH